MLGMARGAFAWGSAMDQKARLLQQVNVSGEDDRPLTFGPEQAGCSCGCIRAPTAVHHRNLSPQNQPGAAIAKKADNQLAGSLSTSCVVDDVVRNFALTCGRPP